MKESVARLGSGTSLVGILTEPSGPSDPRVPALVMLNAGTVHRVGVCRLHVQLARRLADLGYRSLRFDFAGIGDSPPRSDGLPFQRSSVLEIQDALNFLQERCEVSEFILLGLCSGADSGFYGTVSDHRVVGLVQIDGLAYRTPRYFWHHYAPRVGQWGVWKRFLQRPVDAFRVLFAVGSSARQEERNEPIYTRTFPPKSVATAGLRSLVERNVQQLYIYTGGLPEFYNYEEQFSDCFHGVDFHETLQVVYVKESNHIITNLTHQHYVMRTIATWVGRHWPTGVGSGVSRCRPSTDAGGLPRRASDDPSHHAKNRHPRVAVSVSREPGQR